MVSDGKATREGWLAVSWNVRQTSKQLLETAHQSTPSQPHITRGAVIHIQVSV